MEFRGTCSIITIGATIFIKKSNKWPLKNVNSNNTTFMIAKGSEMALLDNAKLFSNAFFPVYTPGA